MFLFRHPLNLLCHPREGGGPEIQLDSRLRGNDNNGHGTFRKNHLKAVYNKALFISLLLHGLAFAGTNWIVSVGSFKGESARLQQTVCVDVEWGGLFPSWSESFELTVNNKKEIDALPHPPKKAPPKEIRKKIAPSRLAENAETLNANAVLIPYSDNPTPTYPEEARRQGLKGEMIFTLTIDGAGCVVKIDVEQGNDIALLLKEAAFEAVKKWRFIRHDKSTKPLSVTLPIVFNLEN